MSALRCILCISIAGLVPFFLAGFPGAVAQIYTGILRPPPSRIRSGGLFHRRQAAGKQTSLSPGRG